MKRLFKNIPLCVLLLNFTGCQSAPAFNFGPYSEAERLYEKEQYEKAIAKYEEYVRENPEGNLALISYYYMARSYEGFGKKEKAREFYQKVLTQSPRSVWAGFAKGRLKELAPQVDKAV